MGGRWKIIPELVLSDGEFECGGQTDRQMRKIDGRRTEDDLTGIRAPGYGALRG